VRQSLAAGLLEVGKMLELQEDLADSQQLQSFMLEVANHFMGDSDKVRANMMPYICDFVALFSDSHQQMLIHTVVKERLDADTDKK
jgi:hypothetical protein